MDGSSVNLAALAVTVPIWQLITGTMALIMFGAGLGALMASVKRSIKTNIAQNNLNLIKQMRQNQELHDKQLSQARQLHDKQLFQTKEYHEELVRLVNKQDEMLEQIICLVQTQLYAIGDPKFVYDGKCERSYGRTPR